MKPETAPPENRIHAGTVACRVLTAIVALILVLPMAAIVLSSVGETAYAQFPPRGFTLKWYSDFQEVPQFLPSLWYSLKLAAIVTVCSVTLAFVTAIGLTLRVIPGKSVVTTFLMSPLVLPSVVVGLALMLFFSTIWSPSMSVGLFIGHMVISFPYALRSILPSLETFDRGLLLASRTLGASPFRSIVKIMLPMARPGLVSAGLFAFLISFDNYNISAFLQDPLNPPLPVVLYNQAEQALSPVLMAISSLLIAFSALVVVAFSKYIVHK